MANSENKSVKEIKLGKENVSYHADYEIDATGLSCPLPLLKMKQMLNKAKAGEVVFVRASDSASQRDFKAYVQLTSHSLRLSQNKGQFLFWITKEEDTQ